MINHKRFWYLSN